MVSGVCGFDQWIDNHIAIDTRSSPTLDEVAEIFEAEGYYYHWWKIVIGPPEKSQQPTVDMYQIYAAYETGWGVQLDFPFHNPPAETPTYAATCQSEDVWARVTARLSFMPNLKICNPVNSDKFVFCRQKIFNI